MKRALLLAAGLAVTAVLVLPAGAAPPPPNPIVNASFEQGFTGWTQTIPAGASQLLVAGSLRPGGGRTFARLTTDGPGNPSSVEQMFNANAGTRITGVARFNDGESGFDCPGFNDVADVSIDGISVFHAESCTTGGTLSVPWSFTLTTSGAHTIVGSVMNGGDDTFDSSIDLDAPMISKVSP